VPGTFLSPDRWSWSRRAAFAALFAGVAAVVLAVCYLADAVGSRLRVGVRNAGATTARDVLVRTREDHLGTLTRLGDLTPGETRWVEVPLRAEGGVFVEHRDPEGFLLRFEAMGYASGGERVLVEIDVRAARVVWTTSGPTWNPFD
jgi:hypothetical protein